MRIAILSDIHGNLVALEAVLADLRSQGPDEVWCGGDIGWTGPRARECLEIVRDQGWPTVRGNADVWLTGDPQNYPGERDEALAIAAQHALDDDHVKWLLSLPIGHSGAGGLLLVHGTPKTPFDAPLPDAPAADFRPYEAQASLVVYAHVHRAFVRRLADGSFVANTGSVGLPMDGETASYLLVDRIGADLVVRHRRVAFDRAAALAQAREAGGALGRKFEALLEGG